MAMVISTTVQSRSFASPLRGGFTARHGFCAAIVASIVLAWAPEVKAQGQAGIAVAGADNRSGFGLSPAAPTVGTLPGGMTPAYGQRPSGPGDWRFDYHGFFTMPIAAGISKRTQPLPGEAGTVFHTPPIVPDDYEVFSHTGIVPTPYAQLNLSYGNSEFTGNVQLAARQATVATGFFDPSSQAGINDVYMTYHPELAGNVSLRVNVGAFTTRYGAMGEYDEGMYGTTLIGRVKGAGENIIAQLGLSPKFTLMLEQGIVGTTNKAPADLTPDYWNDFGDSNVGTTFVNHWHGGFSYDKVVTFGVHYINAFSQDDRAANPIAGDGAINTLAGDLRLTMGRFGHLYLAGSHVRAINARVVSGAYEVLNTRGGSSLIANYLGDASRGNGELLIFGGQYNLSVGRLISYPVPFYGDGPDIVVSLFGMGVSVKSEDTRYDGRFMRKFGGEAAYSLLSWFAASVRFDRVDPNGDDEQQSYAVWSPRLIFRTDWQSQDQLVLQYSRYQYGSRVELRDGTPPRVDPSIDPDTDMVSLSASMWW